ncbi:thioredoxin m [Nannochloropsis gaditana]|uniref:Thioredoxin m n=1 Tax=Nannochloropsis gaditana TaxID=72520 RepID=W7TM82_9STRA|nr:thioredoxin m [Nannochloropsis gaditana]
MTGPRLPLLRKQCLSVAGLLVLIALTQAFVPTSVSKIKSVRYVSGPKGRPLMMAGESGVLKVSGEELEKQLAEVGSPVLLDVYAQWCGPCQILAGELDKVKGLYKDKLRVLKVDSDEEPRIASALKVYGLPTIFFIREGQLIHRVEGAMPASELTKLVNHYCFGAPEEEIKDV